MNDEKKIVKCARFLIENNELPYIDYDVESTNEISIIWSIFRKLLGKYQIPTKEEDEKMFMYFAWVS